MAYNFTAEHQVSFLGGQDASKAPHQISEDSYFSGINISVDEGTARPRWSFKEIENTFADSEGYVLQNRVTVPYNKVFRQGNFQALIPYSVGLNKYVIIVISGVIYLFNPRTNEISVIEIKDKSHLSYRVPRVNWTNAGKYLVIFDYPAYPVIIENFSARRADPAKLEIPISINGSYNQNRLFILNAGNEFTGGDPSGSLATPNAPITFEEVLTPGSPYFAQIFQLPTDVYTNNDTITALTFLPVADTNTGIGPLLVATNKQIYSFQTQKPRIEWENGQFGSVVVYNNGIAGARSFSAVNSDLLYLSADGQLRALSMSRDEQGKWSKTPMSREVQNWLTPEERPLVKYSVVGYFNNKVLVTAKPYRTHAIAPTGEILIDYAHGGFVVLELDNISTLKGSAPPAWAGLWTGVRPMDVLPQDDRLFIMSKDGGENVLYEVDINNRVDRVKKKDRQIVSTIYTRSYNFKDPFQDKDIHSLDMDFNDVKGKFSLEVLYKPHHGTKFIPWRKFTHDAPFEMCDILDPKFLNGFAGHQFKVLNLGAPTDNMCDEVTRYMYRWFRMMQLKFVISGEYWELYQFKFKASPLPQNETEPACTSFNPVPLDLECNTDWNY